MRRAALILGASAILLTACSSTEASTTQGAATNAEQGAPGQSSSPTTRAPNGSSTAQSQATQGALQQDAATRDGVARDGVARDGADYSDALERRGLPAPQSASDGTLAQVARGICGQLAAGASESKIREQLRPVALYAVAQSGGKLDEAQASQIYLDAARETC